MIESGDETLFWGTVERYEHPLLKIADEPASEPGDPVQHGPINSPVINVTSPHFISAVLLDD